MRRTGNEVQARLAGQQLRSHAVEVDDGCVTPTNDQQCWLKDQSEKLAGEVGPSAAGHHCLHRERSCRSGDQRGCGARAGPEKSDTETGRGIVSKQPVGQPDNPNRRLVDIETVLATLGVGPAPRPA